MNPRIVFRYDDFSAMETIPYDLDEALFNLFFSLNIPVLVGVTPNFSGFPRDPSNTAFFPLQQDAKRIALFECALKRGWQMALHGFDHQTMSKSKLSEFSDVAPETQSWKIECGLKILEQCFPNIPVNVFIPPWNNFDDNTVEVLKQQRFSILCGGDAIQAENQKDFQIIPSLFSTAEFVQFISTYSLKELNRIAGDATIVITMHHYEFLDKSRKDYIAVEELAKCLHKITKEGAHTAVLQVLTENRQLTKRQQTLLRAKIALMRSGWSKVESWILTQSVKGSENALSVPPQVWEILTIAIWKIQNSYKQLRSRLVLLKRLILFYLLSFYLNHYQGALGIVMMQGYSRRMIYLSHLLYRHRL